MREFKTHQKAMASCTGVELITIIAAVITIIDWLWRRFGLTCKNCGHEWKDKLKKDMHYLIDCPKCGKTGLVST